MANLDISNVVNISVSVPPVGLANYNINNLLILTKDAPVNMGLGVFTVYTSPAAVLADWGVGSEAYMMAVVIFSQQPNVLGAGGALIIAAFVGGETLAVAITRLMGTTFFGGVLYAGYAASNADVEAAALVVQAGNRLLFAPTSLVADTQAGGLGPIITAATQTNTRVIIRTVPDNYANAAQAARIFIAGAASFGMSPDMTGSATTNTLHMKNIVGFGPDTGITQTILTQCIASGVDCYPSIAGLPKYFSTGANDFFDNRFNLMWFVFNLQVNGFNAMATVATKLPQTENGMAVLRGAYLNSAEQAVTNGYVARGAWNSPELFGNPDDLRRNILDFGYYLYSQPVNQQAQATRVQRIAPLCQLAVKLAGAIQDSALVVNFNP